ncbi:hypothetical protein GCM10027280_56500 [Micromonospora polyrhachis]
MSRSPLESGVSPIGTKVGPVMAHPVEQDETRFVSELIDASGMGTEELDAVPRNALLRSLRRLIAESRTPAEDYASWQNYVDVENFVKPAAER